MPSRPPGRSRCRRGRPRRPGPRRAPSRGWRRGSRGGSRKWRCRAPSRARRDATGCRPPTRPRSRSRRGRRASRRRGCCSGPPSPAGIRCSRRGGGIRSALRRPGRPAPRLCQGTASRTPLTRGPGSGASRRRSRRSGPRAAAGLPLAAAVREGDPPGEYSAGGLAVTGSGERPRRPLPSCRARRFHASPRCRGCPRDPASPRGRRAGGGPSA
jgi:hypothetical protein